MLSIRFEGIVRTTHRYTELIRTQKLKFLKSLFDKLFSIFFSTIIIPVENLSIVTYISSNDVKLHEKYINFLRCEKKCISRAVEFEEHRIVTKFLTLVAPIFIIKF